MKWVLVAQHADSVSVFILVRLHHLWFRVVVVLVAIKAVRCCFPNVSFFIGNVYKSKSLLGKHWDLISS